MVKIIEILRYLKRLSIHRIHYWKWVFGNRKTPQDFYAEATVSIAARWEGEIDPLLTYTGMFDKLYARDTIPFMKPYIESFKFIEQDIRKYYNDRNKYYFFDDRLDNLKTAKSRGWYTIWVNIDFLDKPYYVDYAFPNIHTAAMYFLLEG